MRLADCDTSYANRDLWKPRFYEEGARNRARIVRVIFYGRARGMQTSADGME